MIEEVVQGLIPWLADWQYTFIYRSGKDMLYSVKMKSYIREEGGIICFTLMKRGGGQLFCTTNFRGGGGPLLFWVYNFLSPRRKYIHLHTVFVRDWSKHIVRRGLKLLGGHQIYFSIHMGGDEKLTLMWLPHHIMLFFIFYIQHIIDGRGFFTISLFLNSKGGINITIDHLTKWLWPYPP